MTSMVYPILIFIFLLGSVSAGINGLNIYEQKLPVSGAAMQMKEVESINAQMVETGKNPALMLVDGLVMMGKCVVAGLLAIVTLGPLLDSYHIPSGIYGMFLSPLAFVVVMWLFELWLGRSPE